MAINLNTINQNSQYNKSKPKINLDWTSIKMHESMPSTGMVGKLIPVFVREMIPGQKIKINHSVGIQFNPFVSSVFQEMFGQYISYFVPYRLVYDNWEEFITGGENGEYDEPLETLTYNDLIQNNILTISNKADDGGVPSASDGVYSANIFDKNGGIYVREGYNAKIRYAYGLDPIPGKDLPPLFGSLLDYFGLPILDLFGYNESGQYKLEQYSADIDVNSSFNDLNVGWIKAYNLIWNEVLRYPDISPKRSLTDCTTQFWYWPNDYFTRARVYQQRGISPLVPIDVKDASILINGSTLPQSTTDAADFMIWGNASSPGGKNNRLSYQNDTGTHGITFDVDTDAMGVSLNDFSTALMIARYQYNNAKITPRYIDHLRDRFGVDPQDYRMQLPEYIKGSSFSVNINSVTQTSGASKAAVESGDETPQGYITAQGQAMDKAETISYTAKEHGVIITLMCIRPRAVYANGISPFWQRKNKFDFPTPELYNSIDVPIYTKELFYSINGKDSTQNVNTVFGYKGIYDEYRTAYNKVTGLLRPSTYLPTLKSYTLARYWEQELNEPVITPLLNDEFMLCRPDMTRIISYPSQPDFTFFFDTDIATAIPIPYESQPLRFAEM